MQTKTGSCKEKTINASNIQELQDIKVRVCDSTLEDKEIFHTDPTDFFKKVTKTFKDQIESFRNFKKLFDEYLKNVEIKDVDDKELIELKKRTFNKEFFDDLMKIFNYLPHGSTNNDEWRDCHGKCLILLQKLMNKEINSTAYYLNILTNVHIKKSKDIKNKFVFKLRGINDIPDKWDDVKDKINLIDINNVSNQSDIQKSDIEKSKQKLIIGYGPSASGKTFWAEKIIEKIEDGPNTYFTIDGGEYRERSLVYQFIISEINRSKSLLRSNFFGLNNLVPAGIKEFFDKARKKTNFKAKGIFTSSGIKKNILDFLKNNVRNIDVSLYVPDVFSGCQIEGRRFPEYCAGKLKKYREITKYPSGNNYISVLIFQCKNGGVNCDIKINDKNYNCIGCIESGKKRQVKEGKKYSSDAYAKSIKNALYLLKKETDSEKYVIHNGGGINKKSIIINLNKKPTQGFEDSLFKGTDNALELNMDIEDVANKDYTINYQKIIEYLLNALADKAMNKSLSGTQIPARRRYPIIYS